MTTTISTNNPMLTSANKLKLAVFGFNGGAAFTNHPDRYVPTWESNVRIAQMADRLGIEGAISASRWKAFGRDGHYSGDLFETFTWAAGIAASTKRLCVMSTVHLSVIHPIIAARASATVDLISKGRHGLNLVCGWYPDEMGMFGSEMGDHEDRYALAEEWVPLFDRLWKEEQSFDFSGKFYNLKKAIIQPKSPFPRPVLMNAGGSERGREFAANNVDVAFIVPQDPRPEALKKQVDFYRTFAREKYGKEIKVWMSCYVVQRNSVQEARDYVQDYVVNHGDEEGLDSFISNNIGNAKNVPEGAMQQMRFAIAAGYGGYPLLGTAEDISSTLSSISDAGVEGVLLTWLDYEGGLKNFGDTVLPLLEQAGLRVPAEPLPV
ncbi:LLM class flavin-dependent oxidoreductase [Variovorax paradoxus]|uniref:LLM class flavin-dependent oxidoreductase n=1 Tax=Variovorax paradoxus TaxID=34073 RepID=UPI0027804A74|nr:LLM class flavin-dependent oxidoreductase [Variovorax paradoxus]MDP9932784.1 alkanesulfonate monooxygenase SsuD/methylene tetrahydromethanopterin reductase-like flavin-dependent oxidoreductase (luciferase family) [Variovorax paradoxus]